MHFLATLTAGLSALTLAAAVPTKANPNWQNSPLGKSPISGYPMGNGLCLTDAQATYLAGQFKSVLTNPDRQAANVTATALVADSYVETSDSINILAGFPLGGSTFSGKQAFIEGIVTAQAIPQMTDLDVFHDCTKVSWRWSTSTLGLAKYPVNGINDFEVQNPMTGQLIANHLEFNSIAWGVDTGYKCQFPTGQEI